MPSFAFRAVGVDGVAFHGELVAVDRASLAAKLQSQGAVPLRITPVQAGALRALLARDVFARQDLSRGMLTELMQRLATLLGSGISVEEALGILGERKGAATITRLVQDLLRQLRGGAQLADAMAAHGDSFPPVVIGMVRAGETSGALAVTLGRLADYLQRSEAARQTIRSALIYPTILLVTAAGSIVMVLTVVLPALKPAIQESNASLPLLTQVAFAASDLMRSYWWAIGLSVGTIGLAIRHILVDVGGKAGRDKAVLRVPVVGNAVLQAEVARFARTLGVLAGGGVALPTAMALAQPVISNAVIGKAVGEIASGLREGGGLAEPFERTAIFPDIAVQLVRIGEATGRLDTMLVQLADIFDDQVQRTIGRCLAILVPALTITIGALVAGIIASVMLAVLSINDLAR